VLLAESGAEVEILVRAPIVHWLEAGDTSQRKQGIRGLLYHHTQVGPLWWNWLVARPDLLRILPIATQRYIDRRSIRPEAADWLRPRLANVRITTFRSVASAAAATERNSPDAGRRKHLSARSCLTVHRVCSRHLTLPFHRTRVASIDRMCRRLSPAELGL
jgi:hypothetical protein